jgi:chorismate synthase
MVDSQKNVIIRPLSTYEEYNECVALQQHIWGDNFADCVPASLIMVNQKIGGLTAGAFDTDGKLLGFVFGLTGIKDKQLVHWSHMLGVREKVRDLGLGRRLKLYQREQLLERGVEVIYWTFDSLVARNAHLNLNRLGAEITEYVPDMYGVDASSKLHQGLGMDRFIVAWHIADEHVEQAIRGQVQTDVHSFANTPVVNTQALDEGSFAPFPGEFLTLPKIQVEIPSDIQTVKAESVEIAVQWRATTRLAFMWYLEKGYQVKAFYRDRKTGRCFYGLDK